MTKYVYRILLSITILLGSVLSFAYQDTSPSSAPADNTKVNQRDQLPKVRLQLTDKKKINPIES